MPLLGELGEGGRVIKERLSDRQIIRGWDQKAGQNEQMQWRGDQMQGRGGVRCKRWGIRCKGGGIRSKGGRLDAREGRDQMQGRVGLDAGFDLRILEASKTRNCKLVKREDKRETHFTRLKYSFACSTFRVKRDPMATDGSSTIEGRFQCTDRRLLKMRALSHGHALFYHGQ